jgi:hypothetical protein
MNRCESTMTSAERDAMILRDLGRPDTPSHFAAGVVGGLVVNTNSSPHAQTALLKGHQAEERVHDFAGWIRP